MGWGCTHCDWAYAGDDLGPGIMHETLNPAHRADPDLETVLRWAASLDKGIPISSQECSDDQEVAG